MVLCGTIAFAIFFIVILVIVLTIMSKVCLNYHVVVLVNYSRCVAGSKFCLLAPGHRN